MARRPREPRLDPIRWRRPGRGASIRLTAIAALLALAAAVIWSRPETCASPVAGASVPPPVAGASLPPTGGDIPPALGGDASAATVGASAGATTAATGAPAGGRPAVPPGLVGVPVRLAEPTALALVQPGDKVDLLRVDDTAPVAHGALVLSVTGANDPTTGGLLLALRPAEAEKAVAAPERGFAVLIRPG